MLNICLFHYWLKRYLRYLYLCWFRLTRHRCCSRVFSLAILKIDFRRKTDSLRTSFSSHLSHQMRKNFRERILDSYLAVKFLNSASKDDGMILATQCCRRTLVPGKGNPYVGYIFATSTFQADSKRPLCVGQINSPPPFYKISFKILSIKLTTHQISRPLSWCSFSLPRQAKWSNWC